MGREISLEGKSGRRGGKWTIEGREEGGVEGDRMGDAEQAAARGYSPPHCPLLCCSAALLLPSSLSTAAALLSTNLLLC